jgi:hypothetical protein
MKPLTLASRLTFGLTFGACAVDTGEADQSGEAVSVRRCPSPMPSGAVAGTSLTPAADRR